MNTKQIKRFVTAGHATFTITSTRTGRYMTYQCNKPLGEEDNRGAPIFVKTLTGPDNIHDYTYLGTLTTPESIELGLGPVCAEKEGRS